jgi:hypothetical protein
MIVALIDGMWSESIETEFMVHRSFRELLLAEVVQESEIHLESQQAGNLSSISTRFSISSCSIFFPVNTITLNICYDIDHRFALFWAHEFIKLNPVDFWYTCTSIRKSIEIRVVNHFFMLKGLNPKAILLELPLFVQFCMVTRKRENSNNN